MLTLVLFVDRAPGFFGDSQCLEIVGLEGSSADLFEVVLRHLADSLALRRLAPLLSGWSLRKDGRVWDRCAWT